MWVLYVVRASSRIAALASRVGSGGENFHWVVLVSGCVLLALLIGGLTYQLAQAIAARRYSEKQDELVSNITHELKSPLAAIKLHAQTLEHPGLSETQRARSVEFILAEAERMRSLVDNVLESSRLLARRKRLVLEAVDLGAFLASYLAVARPRVEAQGMHLVVEGESKAMVRATPEALERVLTNLIDNAVRFSVRGGEVRCRLTDQPGKVTIAVEDDGIGIPKSELAKVFDRFYQIRHEIHDRRRGTGLGLSIVSGLVREMRGTVQAFSQEDRAGTRFVVELPQLEAGR